MQWVGTTRASNCSTRTTHDDATIVERRQHLCLIWFTAAERAVSVSSQSIRRTPAMVDGSPRSPKRMTYSWTSSDRLTNQSRPPPGRCRRRFSGGWVFPLYLYNCITEWANGAFQGSHSISQIKFRNSPTTIEIIPPPISDATNSIMSFLVN